MKSMVGVMTNPGSASNSHWAPGVSFCVCGLHCLLLSTEGSWICQWLVPVLKCMALSSDHIAACISQVVVLAKLVMLFHSQIN